MSNRRERKRSLLLFAKLSIMSAAELQKAIENYLNVLLENNEDVFLIEVRINAGNNIMVFLDADDGVTIEKCVQVNRKLYQQIEENGLFEDGNFSLEVSSPGVDEPLKLKRQYKKNIGRTIEVLLNDESKKEGKLISANNDEIVVEETEGKGRNARQRVSSAASKNDKTDQKQTIILFNQIKHAKVLVTF